MSSIRPELIFVSGPQTGHRVVVTSNVVKLGRSARADIPLSEQHASREQLRLTLTHDGWVMENLSPQGTQVNGKRFKSARKKVLLDTGDVMTIGVETEILFVAPGDDPVAALHAYRSKHPLATPQAESQPSDGAAPVEADQLIPIPAAIEQPQPTENLPKAATPESRKQDRIKRFAIAYLVFLVCMGGLVALLSTMSKDTEQGQSLARQLSDKEISEVLSSVPDKSPVPTRSEEFLQQARALYDNLPGKEGERYQCVRSFSLYLAYRREPVFGEVQDERRYQQARAELIRQVSDTYREAHIRIKKRDWRGASDLYQKLLRMLPEQQRDHPVQTRLLKNIREHIVFARDNMPKKRRRSRRR